MTRYRAAAIHLAISLTIGALVFGLIFFVWYPSPLFVSMGGSELAMLVIGIDMILGPLLTLIVFRASKKELRFDLGVIAALQLGALVYGLSIVTTARPVFIVARPDVVYVVTASEIREAELALGTRPEFRSLSWTGPRYASFQLPRTAEELRRAHELNFTHGRDLQQMPEFYLPWQAISVDMLQQSQSLADLLHRKPFIEEEVLAWLRQQDLQLEKVRYLPLLTRVSELVLVIDAHTAQVKGILPIDGS